MAIRSVVLLLALCAVCTAEVHIVTAGNIDAAVDDDDPFTFYIGRKGAGDNQDTYEFLEVEYSMVGDVTADGTVLKSVGNLDYDYSYDGCGEDNYACYYILASDGMTSADNILYTANYLAQSSFEAHEYTLPAGKPDFLPDSVLMREDPWTVQVGEYKFQFFVYNWDWSSAATYFRIQLRIEAHNFAESSIYFNGDRSKTTAASVAGEQLRTASFENGASFTANYDFQQTFNVGDDTFAAARVTMEETPSGVNGVYVNIDLNRTAIGGNDWFLYDPTIMAVATGGEESSATVQSVSVALLCAIAAFFAL